MLTIAILGTGRAGGALAIALDNAGFSIDTLVHRSRPADLPIAGAETFRFDKVTSINSDLLIIATPDQQIETVARRVSEFPRLPKIALHLSGSLTSSELSALKENGVAVGSLHPLVSISDPLIGSTRFAGAYFSVEGDDEAVETANQLVKKLGGVPFSIETRFKPLYHASAVMGSGNVIALFDAAVEMLSSCGLDRELAHAILLPLLQSAVANLAESSTSEALTGPFVRGDIDALHRHLKSIEELGESNMREIYLSLAERSSRLANTERSKDMLNSISIAKRKSGC